MSDTLEPDVRQKSSEVADSMATTMITELIEAGADRGGILSGLLVALVRGTIEHMTTAPMVPTVAAVNRALFPAINKAAEQIITPQLPAPPGKPN